MNIYIIIFSFLSGLVGSMGLGSGTVLIIYLSVILSLEQTKSQGINLLFFVPIAVFSIIVYSKQKLIDKRKVLAFVPFGLLGVGLGYIVLQFIKTDLLSKMFGCFLIVLAVFQLFSDKKERTPDERPSQKS